MKTALFLAVPMLIASCSMLPDSLRRTPVPDPAPRTAPVAVPAIDLPATTLQTDAIVAEAGTAPAPRSATTAEQFDTTTEEERAVAVAAAATLEAAPSALLGRQVVSLGNPAETGLWVATGLVSATRPGRIVDPTSGNAVLVELRPLEGAGAPQISLAALRLLGGSLTALPEVEIYVR